MLKQKSLSHANRQKAKRNFTTDSATVLSVLFLVLFRRTLLRYVRLMSSQIPPSVRPSLSVSVRLIFDSWAFCFATRWFWFMQIQINWYINWWKQKVHKVKGGQDDSCWSCRRFTLHEAAHEDGVDAQKLNAIGSTHLIDHRHKRPEPRCSSVLASAAAAAAAAATTTTTTTTGNHTSSLLSSTDDA